MQMRIVAGGTVAFVFVLVLGKVNSNSSDRIDAIIYLLLSFVVIVASVWFLRSKSQDELDKKTNNHLPLPLDYASNEGKSTSRTHQTSIGWLSNIEINLDCSHVLLLLSPFLQLPFTATRVHLCSVQVQIV